MNLPLRLAAGVCGRQRSTSPRRLPSLVQPPAALAVSKARRVDLSLSDCGFTLAHSGTHHRVVLPVLLLAALFCMLMRVRSGAARRMGLDHYALPVDAVAAFTSSVALFTEGRSEFPP